MPLDYNRSLWAGRTMMRGELPTPSTIILTCPVALACPQMSRLDFLV